MKKLLSFFLFILVVRVLSAQQPTTIKLTQLETSPVVDGTRINQFGLTNSAGKQRYVTLDSFLVIVVDSLTADTNLQVNWYTHNGVTTDLLRQALVKRSAWWRGIDSVGFLRWSNRPDNFNGSQFSLYQDSVVMDADTIIWESTFNTPLQFHDLRADVTYFYADSLKIANVGQFQSVVSLNYDGTDKGFFYDPANEGVFIINGNGISGIYNYLSVKNDRVKIDAFDPVSNNSNELEIRNTYTENDIIIDIGGGDIFAATYYLDQTGSLLQGAFNGVPVSGFSANFGSPSFKLFAFDYFGAGYSNQTTINVQQVTNANYASMSLDTDADSAGISVGIGYAVPGVAQTFRSNDQVFAVQMLDNASSNFFSTLEIDLNQHFDTTENAVSFYNRAYYWKNEMPTGVAGDTLFHYWAEDGVNAGKNPGFITIDQICAHCAADAVNWYNSNGTTTDNTRIATVTETATWLSEDVTADGVFPFRFELTGNSPNEPEMMVWQFPAGDSATLSQSDQELILFSSNQWLFKSNEATTIQADSFQYNPNLGGTGFRVGQYNVVTQNGITGTPTHRDAIEYNTITGTAQTEIFLDGSSAVWVLPTNSGTNFKIHVSAICSAAGNGVGISTGDAWDSWHLGGIKRIGSTTSLVGTVQAAATAQSDAGMSTSVVTIDADDGDESLRIRFTPPSTAGTTTVIRVVASLELTQTSY